MNATKDRKIRFSHAVYAIDSTPKSLRRWLETPGFALMLDRGERRWIAFSAIDLAMLALMRKLVTYGIGVKEANEMARAVIAEILGPLMKASNMPADAITAAATNYTLQVVTDEDGFGHRLLAPFDAADPADALLLIDLSAVIAAALNRAFVDGSAK